MITPGAGKKPKLDEGLQLEKEILNTESKVIEKPQGWDLSQTLNPERLTDWRARRSALNNRGQIFVGWGVTDAC